MSSATDDISSLIQMSAGSPALSVGQAPILPEDTKPTTVDQISQNTGFPKELSSAQQANANILNSLAAGASQNAQSQPVQPAPTTPKQVSQGQVNQPLQPPRITNALPPLVAGDVGLNVIDAGGQTMAPQQSVQSTIAITPQPANPVQQTRQDELEEFTEVDDFAFDAEWEEESDNLPSDVVSPPAAVQATPIAPAEVSPAQQPQPAKVDVVAKLFEAFTPTKTSTTPVSDEVKKFAGDDELNQIQSLMTWIEQHVTKARFDSGIALIGNPAHRDQTNYLHTCIYRVRWEAQTLYNLGPHELLAMEAALTAHQVWIQGEENYWTARDRVMSTELDRLVFMKRENYASTTKTEAENKLISAEPQVRKYRAECMLAKAMATLYKDQGSRFAQLEDGIKRTITMAVEEFNRSKIQTRHQ